MTDTAPSREPRTAAATRARRDAAKARKVRAAAILLRGYGFTVEAPNLDLALIVSPCANGCSDPAAHAEGGHDV